MRTPKFLLTPTLLLVLVLPALGQVRLPAGVERGPAVEGVSEYRLGNGLKVLLVPDPSSSKITVNITYRVGSRHEGYGETGMAHLLEHMLFKGSTHHPDIPQELTEHGADPNGTTWYDRTNYFETFEASEENLDWALSLEADRMVHSFLRKEDLEKEMTVVRNEFEAGENDPRSVLMERVLSTAFLWHGYGRSTIGARSDIENIPIERLQAFYRKYYQPDNAVLIVGGRIDEERTLELIAKHFGAIPRPERILHPTYTREPPQDGERQVTLERVGDVQYLMAAYHVPAGAHPDFPALEVLTEVLGDTPSGRLYKALVEPGQAAGVFGAAFSLAEPGVLLFGAEVRREQPLEPVEKRMLATLEEVITRPPTAEEVERARASLLKFLEMTLNDSQRLALQLTEWEALGDWRLLFLYRDRLEQVTPQDVARVAREYLLPGNRTLGRFLPTEKPARVAVPEVGDIAAVLEGYQGKGPVAQGEAFDPNPSNIEARLERTRVGGVALALLPKKTRGHRVHASMSFRFGNPGDLKGRRVPGEFAAAMLMRGTRRHTRAQIQDELDHLKARVSIGGGPESVKVSIETVRSSLPRVLRLVAEMLKESNFPEKEFEALRQQVLASREERLSDPEARASNALSRHLSPYPPEHPRYAPTLEEEVEEARRITREEAYRFYQEFYGGSNAQAAFVGDFDEDAVKGLMEELFASWKSPRPYRRVVALYKDAEPVERRLDTPDKANAVLLAGLNLELRDDHPDYPALKLANYLLGGGFLNSRLATRIREREGLSYGVGSSLWASRLDPVGRFTAYAIFNPLNLDRVEKALREELQRALAEGFTAEEVKRGIAGFLRSRQVERGQDAALAARLATYLYVDRTMEWDAEFEARVSKLTPGDLQAALRRHLDPRRLSVMEAGDFRGSAASR